MDYFGELLDPVEYFLFRCARKVGRKDLFYRGYEWYKRPIRGFDRFREKHVGKRCFILGGGPSLKRIEPELLKDEITFGVNCVFLIYDWLGFEPTYYVVEDSLVYEDRHDEIVSKVNNSHCFFPVQFSKPSFDRPNHLYFRAIYDFSVNQNWPNFSADPAKLIWIGGTVSYVCLQLAYFMGFTEVYLVGFDHNYVKPTHVTAKGTEWTSHGEDPNHFHKDYFGDGKRWHDPKTDRMELAYKKARKIFEADGRRVLNATFGGQLEIFPRVDFLEIFDDMKVT
jgi:hypothetical protein